MVDPNTGEWTYHCDLNGNRAPGFHLLRLMSREMLTIEQIKSERGRLVKRSSRPLT
jgi:hypothetical protein